MADQDCERLRRLRLGDSEALREIYQLCKDRLLTIAMCLLSDRADAEDCLHDVFVQLAERAETIRIRENLAGYLAVSIANRARDVHRRRARLAIGSLDGIDCPSIADGPSGPMIWNEQSAMLLAALAALPDEQREVIVLHLQGGMTFRQIAGEMAISINTAQSRYRYGIEKLRTLLTEGVRP
jgi:RNA polymerase sigma factor (sigma-70 family)